MFRCPDCGREFRRRIFLGLHKNTHKRFKVRCKLCGKVFYLRSQLYQHVRSHGFLHLRHPSRKPWSSYFRHRYCRCPSCYATFFKPTQLTAHMLEVHAVVRRTRGFIPAETFSTAMLSTIGKLPVGTGNSDFISDSQDSYTDNSYVMSDSLELDGSNSPMFGAKPRSRSPKKALCGQDSPTKSPSCLARERLLRKYHRPHVSSPASRKLFLDQQSGGNNRIPNLRKRTCGNNDPKMPRLTEISILLERVDQPYNNGSMFLSKDKIIMPKNSELGKGKRLKLNENITWKRSDSSGSDDRMPHLHRFSSEEKATDDLDGGLEPWLNDHDSPTGICVDKFDGFKRREGLFDILQHEHEKTSPQSTEKKLNSTQTVIKPTNGLVLKKPILLDAGKISPSKQTNLSVSELIKNESSEKPQSDKTSCDPPVLSDCTENPPTQSHNDTYSENHSDRTLGTEEKVLYSPSNLCDHSHNALSIISDVQQVSPLKYHTPLCYTDRSSDSVSAHNPTLRPKKLNTEGIGFMSDLSELKHQREDQAESYPNSLSSLDDGPDTVTQILQNLQTQFVSRQLSCPVPIIEDVPLKRNRHMTVSGGGADLRDPSPLKARERRRRTKTLSHGCSCCMDVGPSRRRRRRYNRSNTKIGWSVKHVLTEEEQTFVDSSKQLISLRHKVFRLCQVLFPKLSPIWQLNADTEQVDMLVNEISAVIKSLKENKSQVALPIQTPKQCEAKDLQRSQDLSNVRVALVTQIPQDNESDPLTKSSIISKEVVRGKDSRLEDENVCDESSGNSVFLPVLNSKTSDISNLSGDKSASDNFTSGTIQSKGDDSSCSISTQDENLSPLGNCGNVEQSSSEENEPGSNVHQEMCCGQEVKSEVQSRCSSRCESPKHLNNNNCSSQSEVSLTPSSDAMWGCGSNNQWELEFFQYITKSTTSNKPKTLLNTSKPFKKETNSLTCLTGDSCTAAPFTCDIGTSTEADVACETPSLKLLDLKLELCKDPKNCLTQLRRRVIHLLQPLLPNLTLENNFDKFSDDVDMLVDLVTQSTERKL